MSLPDDWDESLDPQSELDKALGNGEWQRAIVWSHVALIELLEQRGLIALYPGMSDRDCLEQLRQAQERSAQAGLRGLEQTTQLLRRALYAQEPAAEEQARSASQEFRGVLSALNRAQPAQRRAAS